MENISKVNPTLVIPRLTRNPMRLRVKPAMTTAFCLLLFCFLPFFALAQKVSHEFLISSGGGLSTLNYKLPTGKKNIGFGGEAGLGYTCLFTKMVGIHFGADIAFYNSNANLNGVKIITNNLVDNEGDGFNMHTTLGNYKESQSAMFVNIPVMFQFQAGKTHKFYAMAGAKVGIPISGKYKVSGGTLTNEAYYPEYDNWLTNQEFAGYGTFSNRNSTGKLKLGISAAISVELGGKWRLGDKIALYTGAFFDYGLNNIAKKENQSFINYAASEQVSFTTNSALPSLTSKMNIMAVGIKVRLALHSNCRDVARNVSTGEGKKEKEKKQKPEKQKAERKQKAAVVNAPAEVIEVIAVPVKVALTSAAEFTTGRPAHAGFPATAMGITWAINIDAQTAKFTTATNALVVLPNKEAYDAITSQEKLKEAFDAGNKVSEFTAKGDANFKPKYLIVKNGETLHLVEMLNLRFKAGESKAYFAERH
jgi:hypothetical protein